MSAPVAIVDPYEAGGLLAPALAAEGVACHMVTSTACVPQERRGDFHAEDYLSILNAAGAVEATRDRLRKDGVGQVLAGHEMGVLLADRLAAALGVPANDQALSPARRDKAEMATAARGRGLRVPEFLCTDSIGELAAWARRRDVWPVVVKPPRGYGSRGVRLCETPRQVARAGAAVLGEPDAFGAASDRVLVQEYVDGEEIVVDTVSWEGRSELCALWRYRHRPRREGPVKLFSSKELLPWSEPRRDELLGFAREVLDALGILYGAAHIELVWTAEGPVLLEAGARLHGGAPAHRMCRRLLGDSQLDRLARAVARPDEFTRRRGEPYRLEGRAVMVPLVTADPAAAPHALPSCVEWILNEETGRPPAPVAGLAILHHRDGKILERDLAQLLAMQECPPA